ncbi:MAG: methyltransferase domain-containing protein [Candidatus Hydrogenedentota bacterium]
MSDSDSGPGRFSRRLAAEREHGASIAERASEIWGWESVTGQRRQSRRAMMLRKEIKGLGRVLEFGAGTGEFTRRIVMAADKRAGRRLVSVDISHDLLLKGRQEGAFDNAWIVECDAHHLPFREGVFDAICGSSILHHLEVENALAEGFRILKPGGRAAFSEPNFANPQNAIVKRSKFLKARFGDTPHETAFFKGQMENIFRKTGFSTVLVEFYDFLYPLIPDKLVSLAENIGLMVEKIPGVRNIAGSLWITARK